ncbi:winged helix-turn helix protein [Azospirillum brasilense]|nr:hypothetical protein AMK58_18675 [Azospirillum brasilense]TVZ72574.1 winged helix-turn helix protein [Azospirillum brasilense]TWB86754.1 winged helix-turn helix protein [Azospirillum brasilense]
MILDLAREGLSVSAIARRTGLDRKTIRKCIARGLEAPAYTPRPARPTLLTPFEPYLRERLQAFPDLNNHSAAARRLGLSRVGLLKMMTRLGLRGSGS